MKISIRTDETFDEVPDAVGLFGTIEQARAEAVRLAEDRHDKGRACTMVLCDEAGGEVERLDFPGTVPEEEPIIAIDEDEVLPSSESGHTDIDIVQKDLLEKGETEEKPKGKKSRGK